MEEYEHNDGFRLSFAIFPTRRPGRFAFAVVLGDVGCLGLIGGSHSRAQDAPASSGDVGMTTLGLDDLRWSCCCYLGCRGRRGCLALTPHMPVDLQNCVFHRPVHPRPSSPCMVSGPQLQSLRSPPSYTQQRDHAHASMMM